MEWKNKIILFRFEKNILGEFNGYLSRENYGYFLNLIEFSKIYR